MSERGPLWSDVAEEYVREIAALRAELAAERELWREELAEAVRAGDDCAAERDALADALRTIAQQQPEVLLLIERNGFVFERGNIGDEPGNWSHLAFTLYTMICLIDTLARHALTAAAQEPLR